MYGGNHRKLMDPKEKKRNAPRRRATQPSGRPDEQRLFDEWTKMGRLLWNRKRGQYHSIYQSRKEFGFVLKEKPRTQTRSHIEFSELWICVTEVFVTWHNCNWKTLKVHPKINWQHSKSTPKLTLQKLSWSYARPSSRIGNLTSAEAAAYNRTRTYSSWHVFKRWRTDEILLRETKVISQGLQGTKHAS